MDWLAIILRMTCIGGIVYAGHLLDAGKLKKYIQIKRFIERELFPLTALCSVLAILNIVF